MIREDHRQTIRMLFALLKFADKYIIFGLADAVKERFKQYLQESSSTRRLTVVDLIIHAHGELHDFLQTLPVGDPFMKLFATSCLRVIQFKEGMVGEEDMNKEETVRTLVEDNPNLAQEMIMLLIPARKEICWCRATDGVRNRNLLGGYLLCKDGTCHGQRLRVMKFGYIRELEFDGQILNPENTF